MSRDPGHFRIVTYNVHKCRGLDYRTRPGRIAEVLHEMQPDIAALQEVLSNPGASRLEDQVRFLAEELGMGYALGQNRVLRGGAYGNAVLSRFPLHSHCNYDLSVNGRERRGCLRTDIALPSGETIHVFNVHLGTSFAERRRQARLLLAVEVLAAEDFTGPRLVLGDFNEWTFGMVSQMLSTHMQSVSLRKFLARARTYPGILPVLHLDHIYHDPGLELMHLHLHRTPKALVASDHLPLLADFRLPPSPDV
jgi:endonuclease/exonuclease/phosphatase family metal-dependent hydrolase